MGTIPTQAEITWNSGHHVFSEGSETYVYMYNDASAEISGGYIAEFSMFDDTTADITGGQISVVMGQGSSSVDVFTGSDVSLLRPNDSSTANVYGGNTNVIFTLGSSHTNIYEGLINEIDCTDLSLVNFFVKTYDFNPTGGAFGVGLLTGTWNSNNAFSIDLRTEDTINHINIIPEPATLILLALGAIGSRRRK